jgi:hypothetical protein
MAKYETVDEYIQALGAVRRLAGAGAGAGEARVEA